MPSNQPEYQKRYFKKWYKENRAKHIATCSANRDKQVKKNQLLIILYLIEHPCVDCGETDIVVLQFDHVHGKKRNDVGSMMMFPSVKLFKEIAKCDVRCANCHVKRTARVVNNYRVQWSASVKAAQPPFKRTRPGAQSWALHQFHGNAVRDRLNAHGDACESV